MNFTFLDTSRVCVLDSGFYSLIPFESIQAKNLVVAGLMSGS